MERDPAAKSRLEVLLCYPSVKAMIYHRLAHRLYLAGHTTLARMISQHSRHVTGIEIHPGACIGRGFFIDHGDGVVIGETTVIGEDVTLYQGVTLGGTGKDVGKRHPTIGNRVTVGAGAKVLECTVVGNPGRIVRRKGAVRGVDLDHVHLPDPVKAHIEALERRVSELEAQIRPDSKRNEVINKAIKEEFSHADL